MTRRASAWLLGLSLPLLLAGSRWGVTWASEERTPGEAELAQFLEGFAPLAKHGEWTRAEAKATLGEGEKRPQGLQDAWRLTFVTPDKSKKMGTFKSKMMAFVAARFETSAQAEAFVTDAHEELLQQQRQHASIPGAREWLLQVSKGAGKDGKLNGHAIDWVAEGFLSPSRFTFQHFHVDRLFVSLGFAGCSHVSRDAQDAFIAYALERLTKPDAVPPPSPDIRVPTREVTFLVRDPEGNAVPTVETTTRPVDSDGTRAAVPLRNGGTMTLPKEPVKVRLGHAAGPDGGPLPLLATDVILDLTQTEVTVTLPRGAPCRIQVLGADGNPVPGAKVRTLSRSLPPEHPFQVWMFGEEVPQEEKFPPIGDGKGTTDAGGDVRLPVDPDHGSKIVVDAGEGFFRTVEEAPSGTTSTVIRLQPGWVLHLVVRDRDGKPVEDDVEVRIQGKRRRHETDADGRAEIGPLVIGPVHVRANFDQSVGLEEWTEVKPTRDPVVLTLKSHLLRLRVLDAAGSPVPTCWVDVGIYAGGSYVRGYGRETKGPITLSVPTGQSSIEVREAKDAEGRPLNLAAAGAWTSPDARELTLHMQPGLTMTGTVRTEDGRPVAKARVMAHRHHDVYARAETDAEGRYELVGLDPRVLEVIVRPPEGFASPRPRDVLPSTAGTPVDFTLPKVVPITIVDWRGQPVLGAWVRVKVIGDGPEAGSYPIDDHTGEDGIAYLANLYPDQELHVMPQNSKDLASLRQPWDGSPTTLRLERSHRVKVRVVDGSGPVVGANVQVEGGEDHADETGPDGNTDVLVPSSRTVRLRAQRSYSDPWSPWVRVTPRELTVELRVPDVAR